MRFFVLVTAIYSAPESNDLASLWRTKSSSGIKKLKRGTELCAFIADYLSQFQLENQEQFTRGDTHVVISRDTNKIMQWSFTMYKEKDLLHAVSHLTREELLRDLKELLPLKELVQ